MRFGIILILLLLSACAQVGTLGGGETDKTAPAPKLDKMEPKNESTSFNGKTLTIPFDEFIKLNNPSETIVVVPPNIKPTAKVKNKTLFLSWEENLLPNTTYAFYLNGTIQDTKESNDSLMTFVFSTGETIDSLSATYFVRDAFTNEPIKGALIGLFDHFSDTVRPTYFAQTDTKGEAKLKYLKTGKYEVVAFEDKNKDLKHQADERLGYLPEPLKLTENRVDSLPIRMYFPEQKRQITTFSFNAPGSFTIASNQNLEKTSFAVNGQKIEKNTLHFFASDSLLFPFSTNDSSDYTLVAMDENWSDTSSVRITQKEKSSPLKLQVAGGNEILPKLPITLFATSEISSVVAPFVQVVNIQDSSLLPVKDLIFNGNQLKLNFDRTKITNVLLRFLPGAFTNKNDANKDTITLNLTCLQEKELGNMMVDVSKFDNDLVLEILMAGKSIQSVPMKKGKGKHQFTNLKPGDYSFRIVLDENANGRWDVGNRAFGKQPETVMKFAETKKVRANWDLDVELKPLENGN